MLCPFNLYVSFPFRFFFDNVEASALKSAGQNSIPCYGGYGKYLMTSRVAKKKSRIKTPQLSDAQALTTTNIDTTISIAPYFLR